MHRDTRHFLLFVSLWLVGLVLFSLGPLLAVFVLSLTGYAIVEPPRWIGFHHYRAIFSGLEPNFYNSVKVTLLYTLAYVPLLIAAALTAAALLNVRGIRGRGLFRTLFYAPSLIPAVAGAIVWAWIFNPRYGLLNTLLRVIGIAGPDWLQHPDLALGCMVVVSLWGFGTIMVILLAALQGVPEALLEAAIIDGASGWHRFRHVTIPQISPALFFCSVMAVIGAFQVFTVAFVMAQANAVNRKATHFYVINIYDQAFGAGRFGLACALAVILFLVIMLVTAIQFGVKRYWVHYDA